MISLFIILIIFVGFLYIIGNSVTGYLVYSKNLEKEIDDMKKNISVLESANNEYQQKISEYVNKLGLIQSNLSECNKINEGLTNYNKRIDILIAECEVEKIEWTTKYENKTIEFANLLRNSVIYVCCRPGIEVTNWNLTEKGIICSGGYSTNCTTGEVI